MFRHRFVDESEVNFFINLWSEEVSSSDRQAELCWADKRGYKLSFGHKVPSKARSGVGVLCSLCESDVSRNVGGDAEWKSLSLWSEGSANHRHWYVPQAPRLQLVLPRLSLEAVQSLRRLLLDRPRDQSCPRGNQSQTWYMWRVLSFIWLCLCLPSSPLIFKSNWSMNLILYVPW